MLFDFAYYIMRTNERDIMSRAAKVKKSALMHFRQKYKASLELLVQDTAKEFR